MINLKLYFKMLAWSSLVTMVIILCCALFIKVTSYGNYNIKHYFITWVLLSLIISIGAYFDELKELKNNKR